MTLLNRLDEAQRVLTKQSIAGVQDGTSLNMFLHVCSENSFGLQHLILTRLVLFGPAMQQPNNKHWSVFLEEQDMDRGEKHSEQTP